MAKVLGKSRVSGNASAGGYAVLADTKLDSCKISPRTNEGPGTRHARWWSCDG